MKDRADEGQGGWMEDRADEGQGGCKTGLM